MQQMKISLHLGAHCTDEDQLVKSLMKNTKVLAGEGVVVPRPARYRPAIRSVLAKLSGQPPSEDTQDVLLEQILGAEEPERLVLSSDQFLANADYAFRSGALYRNAAQKTARIRRLFPDHPVEFFLAVRNPATFVPALYQQLQPGDFAAYTSGIEPDALVWSDVIHDIREAIPDAPITVWCNEDTPLIWPEVMHEITGVDPQVQLVGGFDILSKIIHREGMGRLRSYLSDNPPATEIQRRRVLTAFLDKYAIEDEVEEELDLPGWTPELIDHLTNVYDDDMIEVARIPGVTLITA